MIAVQYVIAVQRLSPLTFGLVLWHSEELVLSEADLRRHEVAVKLVRKELDVLVVLINSGLKRRRGRGKRGREKEGERREGGKEGEKVRSFTSYQCGLLIYLSFNAQSNH